MGTDAVIIVTGSSGRIGVAVMRRFAGRFGDLVGFHREAPKPPPDCVHVPVEITSTRAYARGSPCSARHGAHVAASKHQVARLLHGANA